MTELFRNGAGAAAIQQLAGHADLATTQRYADLDANDLRSAIELIDGNGVETALGDGATKPSRVARKLSVSAVVRENNAPRLVRPPKAKVDSSILAGGATFFFEETTQNGCGRCSCGTEAALAIRTDRDAIGRSGTWAGAMGGQRATDGIQSCCGQHDTGTRSEA